MAEQRYYATGKRKTAVARVWLTPGDGSIQINKQSMDEYFGGLLGNCQRKIMSPFEATETSGNFNVIATLKGGGKSAQTDALRHGIARALLEVDAEHRFTLKRAGFLTRDPRTKERKKYGQKGARARFQFSKR